MERHVRLAACESQRRDSHPLNEIPRLSYIDVLTRATSYELSTLYARDKGGEGGIDRVSGSSGLACASARPTCFYDDHV